MQPKNKTRLKNKYKQRFMPSFLYFILEIWLINKIDMFI